MKVVLSGISENSRMRGVERYAFELAKGVACDPRVEKVTLLCGVWQEYYSPLEQLGVEVVRVRGLGQGRLSRHFFHAFRIGRYFKENDVVHVCNTLPIVNFSRRNYVVTVHDVAEYFVPEKYGFFQRVYRKAIVRMAVFGAKRVLTVSNFSADAIASRLGVDRRKIVPVYNGCDHLKESSDSDDEEFHDYVLYWGVIERTKGLENLIKSVRAVRESNPALNLVVVGSKGNAWADVSSSIEGEDWISYLGFVSDSRLASLIRHAKVIAFPSIYEGFGLPAMEAFLYNDNVVASSTSALGEITKDFAWQVDPDNVDSIAKGIGLAISQPKEFSSAQRNKILEKFRWKGCADLTVTVYESCNTY